VESSVSPSPTVDLVSFVEDVTTWTGVIGRAYLKDDELLLLDAARDEIAAVQLRAIEQQIQGADEDTLRAAGFTVAQTEFKLASARRSMGRAERVAKSKLPGRRKKILEGLDLAVENIQTVLGSLSSLSKWIEAASELVGVAASGIKSAVAENGPLRRTWRKRKRRRDDPAPAGPVAL
jgi:hypothetical protein